MQKPIGGPLPSSRVLTYSLILASAFFCVHGGIRDFRFTYASRAAMPSLPTNAVVHRSEAPVEDSFRVSPPRSSALRAPPAAPKSCLDWARQLPEPYTSDYQKQRIDLDGPVYAYHHWDGPIDKDQLELQKRVAAETDCRVVLKVKGGELFLYNKGRCYDVVSAKEGSAAKIRFAQIVEMILLALEMYDVPDVDFALELDDADFAPSELAGRLPVMTYSLRVEPSVGNGFTFPSYEAYMLSLGRHQMQWYRQCLEQRYPRDNRISKAVWRGSTTGNFLASEQDVIQNRRIALAQMGTSHPTIIDSGISKYVQTRVEDPRVMRLLREKAPLRERIPIEDFNRYRVVIDVDGNAWSDRFFRLMAFNTPILKQEYSNWKEYYSEFVQSDTHVQFFKEDLSDLAEKVEASLASTQTGMAKELDQSFSFAMEHLSHLGVIRAMAYSMTKYASHITWEVEREEADYVHISPSRCCVYNPSLPKALVNKMRNRI